MLRACHMFCVSHSPSFNLSTNIYESKEVEIKVLSRFFNQSISQSLYTLCVTNSDHLDNYVIA